MTVTEGQVQTFAEAIADLYGQLLLSDLPEKAAYRGYLDGETPFGLDDHGYRVSYLGLLRDVFQLPSIGEQWSEDGIQELGHQLMLKLAEAKRQGNGSPDFDTITRDWLKRIDVEFEEFDCYTAVAGLSVDEPLAVSEVTFLPLETSLPEFEDSVAESFREDLNSFRNCLSCSKVSGEWRRASEIHRQKTEEALNVLRFIGALVWHDQPTRHIYIASQDPKRVSDSLVVSEEGLVSRVGASEFEPIPFRIDRESIQYAQFYGFDEVQSILRTNNPSELQQAFLTAIQWFGQATQELLPLVAFVKYYISIETVLKKESESAKLELPRRLGVLIEPWDKSRYAKLESDLKDFIDERNAVFHSGAPLSATPEELEWEGRILARQALHQLRLRLASDGWQNKDDLVSWVATQHQKYLV